jgi:hypothetical protein
MAATPTSAPARTFDKYARAAPDLKEREQNHPPAEQPDGSVTLLDLKPKSCRWPVNSPAPREDYYFCGAQTNGQKPYCKVHCAIAYQ